MQPTGFHAFPIEKSKLFKLWELEKTEIDKLKWLESERLGKDCGYYFAVWEWSMRFRETWLSGIRVSGIS